MSEENEINGKIGLLTKLFTWFDKLRDNSKVVLLLLIAVGLISYLYYNHQIEEQIRIDKQINDLKADVAACAEVSKELEKYKANTILLQASNDFSPNAQWLTAVGTNNVLWVNKAYERKYLRPKGLSASDLIGTDGADIFGEEIAKKFANNNDLVLDQHKPIVFNEIVKTLKYEVKIGSFTYAIGGMEYEEF